MLSSAACELAIRLGTIEDSPDVYGAGDLNTFDKFAAVDLARSNFEGYDMVLGELLACNHPTVGSIRGLLGPH